MRKAYLFKSCLLLSAALALLTASPAAAQEKGQVGLAMGYPGNVAAIFHASESIAIRPDFAFSTSSTTSTYSSTSSTNDNTSYGVGVSALFYAGKWDSLHAYFSPRFGYAHSGTDVSGSSGSTGTSTSSTYTFSGSFGAQYALGRRFAVFGEAGIAYSHLTGESSSSASTLASSSGTGNSWSTRTAIGGIFYLK